MASIGHRRAHGVSSIQKKPARFSEPKKEKRVVTTNVLFKLGHDRVRKHDKKTNMGRSALSRRSSPPQPKRYSLASESNNVLDDYRGQVTTAAGKNLSNVYKDLSQRLDQTTSQPNSLAARIAQTAEQGQTAMTPLADQMVKVRFKNPNGNIVHGHVAIGETISSFKKKFHAKRRELEDLWSEWDRVRQDIAVLGAQTLQDLEFPVQFGLHAAVDYSVQASRSKANEDIADMRAEVQNECERARGDAESEKKDSAQERKDKKAQFNRFFAETMG